MTASDSMSWRRFIILLRGLSPQSALAATLRQKNSDYSTNTGKKQEIPEAESDEKAEQMLYKMLGVKPKEGD